MAISYKFLRLFLILGVFGTGSASYWSDQQKDRTTLSPIRTALYAGEVYGAKSWMQRDIYRLNRHAVPTVCFNDKYVSNQYGNISYSGRFICPKARQDDGRSYCCGEKGAQTCFGFFSGRLADIFTGVIVSIIIIGVLIVCYLKMRQKKKKDKNQRMEDAEVVQPFDAAANYRQLATQLDTQHEQAIARFMQNATEHEQAVPFQPPPRMDDSAETASYQPRPPTLSITYPVQPQGEVDVPPPSYQEATSGLFKIRRF